MTAECTHLESVEITELPSTIAGCEECLEQGTKWCHLRICLTCGHVGCCDSSPGRHATEHSTSSGHPLMRSAQPGENWSWCFVDEVGLIVPGIEGSPEIPPSPLCP